MGVVNVTGGGGGKSDTGAVKPIGAVVVDPIVIDEPVIVESIVGEDIIDESGITDAEVVVVPKSLDEVVVKDSVVDAGNRDGIVPSITCRCSNNSTV